MKMLLTPESLSVPPKDLPIKNSLRTELSKEDLTGYSIMIIPLEYSRETCHTVPPGRTGPSQNIFLRTDLFA